MPRGPTHTSTKNAAFRKARYSFRIGQIIEFETMGADGQPMTRRVKMTAPDTIVDLATMKPLKFQKYAYDIANRGRVLQPHEVKVEMADLAMRNEHRVGIQVDIESAIRSNELDKSYRDIFETSFAVFHKGQRKETHSFLFVDMLYKEEGVTSSGLINRKELKDRLIKSGIHPSAKAADQSQYNRYVRALEYLESGKRPPGPNNDPVVKIKDPSGKMNYDYHLTFHRDFNRRTRRLINTVESKYGVEWDLWGVNSAHDQAYLDLQAKQFGGERFMDHVVEGGQIIKDERAMDMVLAADLYPNGGRSALPTGLLDRLELSKKLRDRITMSLNKDRGSIYAPGTSHQDQLNIYYYSLEDQHPIKKQIQEELGVKKNSWITQTHSSHADVNTQTSFHHLARDATLDAIDKWNRGQYDLNRGYINPSERLEIGLVRDLFIRESIEDPHSPFYAYGVSGDDLKRTKMTMGQYVDVKKNSAAQFFERKTGGIKAVERMYKNMYEASGSAKLNTNIIKEGMGAFGGPSTITQVLAGAVLMAGVEHAALAAQKRLAEVGDEPPEGVRHESILTVLRRMRLTDFGTSLLSHLTRSPQFVQNIFKTFKDPSTFKHIKDVFSEINSLTKRAVKAKQLKHVVTKGGKPRLSKKFHSKAQEFADHLVANLELSKKGKGAIMRSIKNAARTVLVPRINVARGFKQYADGIRNLVGKHGQVAGTAFGIGVIGALGLSAMAGKADPKYDEREYDPKTHARVMNPQKEKRAKRGNLIQKVREVRQASGLEGLRYGGEQRQINRVSFTDFGSGRILQFMGKIPGATIQRARNLVRRATEYMGKSRPSNVMRTTVKSQSIRRFAGDTGTRAARVEKMKFLNTSNVNKHVKYNAKKLNTTIKSTAAQQADDYGNLLQTKRILTDAKNKSRVAHISAPRHINHEMTATKLSLKRPSKRNAIIWGDLPKGKKAPYFNTDIAGYRLDVPTAIPTSGIRKVAYKPGLSNRGYPETINTVKKVIQGPVQDSRKVHVPKSFLEGYRAPAKPGPSINLSRKGGIQHPGMHTYMGMRRSATASPTANPPAIKKAPNDYLRLQESYRHRAQQRIDKTFFVRRDGYMSKGLVSHHARPHGYTYTGYQHGTPLQIGMT